MIWSGIITHLFSTPEKSGAMAALDVARFVSGRGIEGDRYFLGAGTYSHLDGPDRQVTLIEEEVLAALMRDEEIEITPQECRRNVVTQGVPLAFLVGREFKLGSAVLRGVRLNQPCKYLNKMLERDVFLPLYNRSGLNCEVVQTGEAKVGDALQTL